MGTDQAHLLQVWVGRSTAAHREPLALKSLQLAPEQLRVERVIAEIDSHGRRAGEVEQRLGDLATANGLVGPWIELIGQRDEGRGMTITLNRLVSFVTDHHPLSFALALNPRLPSLILTLNPRILSPKLTWYEPCALA